MKQFFYISLLLLLTQTSSAQHPLVFEKFDDFEKAIIKEDNNVYVINFWATWCAPCVKELPYFEKLHQENKKVKVILVSIDSRKDFEKKLLPFIERKKITANVVMLTDTDYNTWLSKIDNDWSGAIPATLIINGKKKSFAEQEFDSFTQLNDYVNSFINLNK